MEYLFRRQISLAQKTADDACAYGRGYNYSVEIQVPAELKNFAKILDETLAFVDHRALGLDLNLGFDPDSASLCEWLHRRLEDKASRRLKSVWRRGDGFGFSIGFD